MRRYAVSATILATFEVEAASPEEAARIVRPILRGGHLVVTEGADNQEWLETVCDVEGDLEVERVKE